MTTIPIVRGGDLSENEHKRVSTLPSGVTEGGERNIHTETVGGGLIEPATDSPEALGEAFGIFAQSVQHGGDRSIFRRAPRTCRADSPVLDRDNVPWRWFCDTYAAAVRRMDEKRKTGFRRNHEAPSMIRLQSSQVRSY